MGLESFWMGLKQASHQGPFPLPSLNKDKSIKKMIDNMKGISIDKWLYSGGPE